MKNVVTKTAKVSEHIIGAIIPDKKDERKAEEAAAVADAAREARESVVVGIERWKEKAQDANMMRKKREHISIRAFSKDKNHHLMLRQNIEDITLELPLPIKRMLYEEAYPILYDLLQAYERTLGKNNRLTDQTRIKLESMAQFMKSYDEM